jgi:hypothetical protein
VRADTDIAVALDRGFACHSINLRI